MLEIIGYTKKYYDIKAVDNLSITIEDGDIYGFIGHNGAGKTTTIKAIMGIHEIESGDIRLDGVSIRENPIECKKKMAYVPDNTDLYNNMSGIKYINFICDVYETPQAVRDANIKMFAESFDMVEDLASPIGSYSHGMKQKTALIAAFSHNPKLVVLDEPFVGLDPKASFIMKEHMRKICSEGGMIFFSTHVLEVAEKLCNKIAIIQKGRLVRSGTTEEVRGDSSLEEIFFGLTETGAEDKFER